MKWTLLGLILFSHSLWAQLNFQTTVSREILTSDAGELKKILLYEGALKGAEHFAKDLGFEFKPFHEKLLQKFEIFFGQFKQRKLLEKFGNGQDKLSAEEKGIFFKSLEKYRETELIKFSHLLEVVQSSKIKSFIQQKDRPHFWSGELELVLDKVKLDHLMKKILSEGISRERNLWVVTEFNWIGFSWTDLGLEKESSFVEQLSASWKKWISENLPQGVGEAEVCSSECASFYKKWEQLTLDQLISSVENDFSGGAWVKVTINLRRLRHSAALGESQFEWDGKLVVLDINTKRILSSFELSPEKKEWRNLEQKALNSALATRIYKTPLIYFKGMNQVFGSTRSLNRVSRLVIKGQKNMSDVMAVVELLKNKGYAIGLEIKLDKIRSNEAEVICFYQGEEKSFTDLLSQLKELKSSESYRLVNEFTGIHHVLKLVNE